MNSEVHEVQVEGEEHEHPEREPRVGGGAGEEVDEGRHGPPAREPSLDELTMRGVVRERVSPEYAKICTRTERSD